MSTYHVDAAAVSDEVLLVISIGGFFFIALAIYIILPPSFTTAEKNAHGSEGEGDVPHNRAQRRAWRRARARSTESRIRETANLGVAELVQENENEMNEHEDESEEDVQENEDQVEIRTMTRRERIRAAKRAEREERRRNEEQRREELRQQREIEDEAYVARKAEEAKEAEMEQKQKDREMNEMQEAQDREYSEWKGMFSVNGKGIGMASEEDRARIDGQIVEYVKRQKVVYLDALATRFHLSSQEVVLKLRALERERKITGIRDERGKFVHIEPEEMKAVAEFVRQRGRVTLHELAVTSGELINLKAVVDEVSESDLDLLGSDHFTEN